MCPGKVVLVCVGHWRPSPFSKWKEKGNLYGETERNCYMQTGTQRLATGPWPSYGGSTIPDRVKKLSTEPGSHPR